MGRFSGRTSKATGASALVLCTLILWMTTVGAHGDEGTMEVIKTEVTAVRGAGSDNPGADIDVEVGIVYANDDDLATEANVMVTATGPSGEVVGPINLPVIEDARYGATITVPGAGAWTLAFTSDTPVASSTAAVDVPTSLAPPSTEAPVTSDAPGTSDPETTIDTTTPEDSAPSDTTTPPATSDDEDDGGSIIGYVVVVLAIAGITTAVVVIRGRRRAASDGA